MHACMWITFILLFVFSLTHTTSASSTTLSVDPQNTVDFNLQASSTFTINITVTDVVDLYGYDFKLKYNTSVLTATNIIVGPFLLPGYFELINQINDAEGWLNYAVTQEFTAPAGVNGNGVLATVNFTVDDYGASVLDLYEIKLIDSYNDLIYHEVIDGYFSNKLAGDANGDGTVDIFDIGTISAHWYPGPPVGPLGYDIKADMNLDGNIDIET